MDLAFIARLLDLVERSDIAELDLTLDGARLRLVKAHAASPGSSLGPGVGGAPAGTAALSPGGTPRPAEPAPPGAGREAAGAAGPKPLHRVRAGFPGTFYRAPAPNEKPFVAEGDRVEDGTQVAIVEAMKTMNPVEADRAGTVVGIVPADGQAVETGDVLFEIEPT